MKIGTILRNLWAGYETYVIFMGHPVRSGKNEPAKVGVYDITNVDGQWVVRKGAYYRCDLNDREHYPVVGFINMEEQKNKFIADVLKTIGAE